MPLVENDGDTYVLFELRAKHMKTQPGEVCFPGGRIEPGEKAVDCAVREACEELGIFKEDIEVFCELDSSRNSAGSVIYRFMGDTIIYYKKRKERTMKRKHLITIGVIIAIVLLLYWLFIAEDLNAWLNVN